MNLPRMRRPDADSDDDEALVRRIGAGDHAACAALVDRHLARIHAFAARVLGDPAEAEEVAQDVFLRVWEHAARWRPQGARFSTWLYQVALNACRDRLRRRRELLPLDESAAASPEQSPEWRMQETSVSARVRDAMSQLPERQREALVLCHFHELPQAEAAVVLGVSIDALESLLARGRRGLRQRLLEERPHLTGGLP